VSTAAENNVAAARSIRPARQVNHRAFHPVYFFFAPFYFLMPSFRNLIAFFGPPVPVILNFFPGCLL
jgi:hypothetical protein